ncbi:hypothetical protein vseg_008969 [Gypsophila vaccaria]
MTQDTPTSSKTPFHPAYSVSNIKNYVQITLEAENVHYASWAELFLNTARAFDVIDHIAPPKDAVITKDAQWNRLDAIVKQWIYSTISIDLLHTILEPGATAQGAWDRLKDIFNDNKHTRAVMLEQQFANIHMDSYPNVSSYCQALKMVADQLSNVGAPVSDTRLVLQLVTHVSDGFEGIATIIQQQDPLPPFYKARSMLALEENNRRIKSPSPAPDTALVVTPSSASGDSNFRSNTTNSKGGGGSTYKGKGNNGGRPYKGNYRGKNNNGGISQNAGPQKSRHGQQPQHGTWTWVPFSPSQQQPPQQGWSTPPCPYPTAYWAPPGNSRAPGILGPRPGQAFIAQPTPVGQSQGAFVPTDIAGVMQSLNIQPPDDNYYMDTGASSHMTASNGNLSSYSSLSNNRHIIVGNGSLIPIVGRGTLTLPHPHQSLTLNNILHVPNIIKNLVSVRQFTTDNRVSVKFDPFGFTVKDLKTGMPIMRSHSTGDLYPLLSTTHDAPADPPHALTAIPRSTWHGRLGHPGSVIFNSLCTNKMIPCRPMNNLSVCNSCQLGKHIKLSFSPSLSSTVQPFDIIHTDLWTSPILSTMRHRYYILFLDDFTNFVWTFPLTNKSHVPQIFTSLYNMIKTQFNLPIKTLQCDNGREFDNTTLQNFFRAHGMLFRFSCPHTSPQNGKAERKIRTLNNIMRTLLIHAHMPPEMWHHALAMATYIHNILPSKANDFTSPTSSLYHRVPTYTHLRTFGCLCYPHTPSTTIHKLAPRATPCVFIGYPSNHRGYKCLDLVSRKVIISRHVTFDESIFPFANPKPTHSPSYTFLDTGLSPYVAQHATTTLSAHTETPLPNTPLHGTSDTVLHTPLTSTTHGSPPIDPTAFPTHGNSSPDQGTPFAPTQHTSPPPNPTSPQMTTRAKHGIFKPKPIFDLSATTTPSPIPKSPIAALHDPHWNHAMKDEYAALIKNRTWVLVPRPPNVNVTRCLWLFKHKFKANGDLERYKARLVVNGRSQQVGIDCDETFSPVVKPATIRTVLSLAVSKHWPIHQLDVKNAFLHGHLAETVYMHQPPGFRDRTHPDHVCLLKKSLYGLKQAPRAWYQRFASYVSNIGFVHSKSDNSLFIYKKGADTAYLLLYVDDIILTTSTTTLRDAILANLRTEFSMTDLGPINFFLGVSAVRHKHGLFLHQHKYTEDIINRAKMTSCKPAKTPVDTKAKLSATSGKPVSDPTLFRSLAGALQYLTFTRPDISYAVQQICLFMHDPREAHLGALKRIIRYLQGTSRFGLYLHASSTSTLTAYTDADWSGCPDSRRSTSGYCVYLGDNLISWSSKRQATVSRSSAEAEYRGVANVVAEACWLRNLLLELHCPIRQATVVYCDNVSAIYLSGNPVNHQRTKHIEIDVHFVREKVAVGQVKVCHVPSRFQYADIFTKGLPSILFDDFRASLSVRLPPASTEGAY